MQFRKNLLGTIGFMIFLPFCWAYAQQLEFNEDGDKIIVFSDGSWRYFDEKDPEDQKIWKQYQRQTAQPKNETNPLDKDRLQNAWNKLNDLQKEARQATIDRLLIEEKLEELDKDNPDYKAQKTALKAQRKELKEVEKEKLNKRKTGEKLVKIADKLTEANGIAYNNLLIKYEEQQIQLKAMNEWEEVELAAEKKAENIPGAQQSEIIPYNPATDVMNNPPTPDCQIASDKIDDFARIRRVDYAFQPLFQHTNDQLRPYLKGEDYIIGDGFLSRLSDGRYLFTLEITIASQYAQQEFGMLEKGAPLTIGLLNGTKVRVTNLASSLGTQDPATNYITYIARCELGPKDRKLLSKGEVDKIRVVWSTGYEDYEVYEMDFFKTQLQCLEDMQ